MTVHRDWMSEALERDRKLRMEFAVTAWPGDDEEGLKVTLLDDTPPALHEYPFVWADEWFVVPGQAHLGKGDLVFTDGHGRFAIVELKWFDHNDTGKTRRSRRNNKRKKLREQAERYAKAFRLQEPDALDVRAFTFGNLYDDEMTLDEIAV